MLEGCNIVNMCEIWFYIKAGSVKFDVVTLNFVSSVFLRINSILFLPKD
jgi:hypothetical protein